jgi:preprotein translocase subunit SecF
MSYMQLIKPGVNINFIGMRRYAYMFSLTLILISIVSLAVHKGPKYGIDFSGGTLIQVKFSVPVKIENIKEAVQKTGFGDSTVQSFGDKDGNEFLIRTESPKETGKNFTEDLQKHLNASTSGKVEIRRVEMVGPQVGKDLQEKALLAIFFSILFITIYISGRFEMKWLMSGVMAAALMGTVYLFSLFGAGIPILILVALVVTIVCFYFLNLRYAMGAIAALIHDTVITVGLFSILDKEISLVIVAALLTLIGYSLNDTIVVYDRIRENQRNSSRTPMEALVNRSINETLSRTILTSGTVLFVVLALFFFGGDIIHDFAFALLVGVISGTYSTIFVSSPLILLWGKKQGK